MKRYIPGLMVALAALALIVGDAQGTVTNSANSVSHACVGGGAGSDTNIAIPFSYQRTADLEVATITSGGVVTLLTISTSFTLSVASTTSTATLTLLAPATTCPVGNTLRIRRLVAITQEANLRTQGQFTPSAVEAALDKLTMAVQQATDAGTLSTVFTGNPGLTVTGGPSRGALYFNPTALDPTNPVEGETWYNSTSHLLKLRDNTATRTLGTDTTSIISMNTTLTSATAPYLIFSDSANPGAVTTPASGVKLYGSSHTSAGVGMAFPAYMANVGSAPYNEVTLPPGMASNWMAHCAQAVAGSTSLAVSNGWNVGSFFGTATAVTPAGGGTFIASLQALDVISSALAGSSGGFYSNAPGFLFRGVSPQGGFQFFARFGTTTAVAQQRLFVGLTTTTGAALANANPSALLNTIYIGYDSAATTLSACSNDGVGTATCASLGASFPVSATAVYDVYLSAPPGTGSTAWGVQRLDTAVYASGTFSDLPSTSTMLAPQVWVNNGTTASSATVRFSKLCVTSHF